MAVKKLEEKSGQHWIDPIKGEKLTYSDRAVNGAGRIGLPRRIEAEPGGRLGCGCQEAFLVGVGKISQNGEIEADYNCDYGYHNYVLYQLQTREMENSIKRDKNGNLVEQEGYAAESFEEY